MRRLVRRDRPAGHLRAVAAQPRPRRSGATCCDLAQEANAEGADLAAAGGAAARSTCCIGFQTFHPFRGRPTYLKLARPARSAERVAELREPEIREAILAETVAGDARSTHVIGTGLDRIFPIGEPPDYEPGPERSHRRHRRAREGRDPEEVLYDLHARPTTAASSLMRPLLGYSYGNLDDMREMMLHPERGARPRPTAARTAAPSATRRIPTFMLTHWARDRDRGERLPLELVVQKQTRDTAALYGLGDRGVVAPGYRADLNVIDFDALSLALPELVHDLPGGARRLIQRADGYGATIVAGVVTMRDGEDTGARPGELVRGMR